MKMRIGTPASLTSVVESGPPATQTQLRRRIANQKKKIANLRRRAAR